MKIWIFGSFLRIFCPTNELREARCTCYIPVGGGVGRNEGDVATGKERWRVGKKSQGKDTSYSTEVWVLTCLFGICCPIRKANLKMRMEYFILEIAL